MGEGIEHEAQKDGVGGGRDEERQDWQERKEKVIKEKSYERKK